MNWELVLQVMALAVVFTICGIILYCTWDVAQKSKHDRAVELMRLDAEAEDRRAERADRWRVGNREVKVEPGAINIHTFSDGERA